jgi:hypothetical protein
MKQLILILALATLFSCRKEAPALNQTHTVEIESDQFLLDGIIFNTIPYPKKNGLFPSDFILINDTCYSSTTFTMTGVTLRVFNLGGYTKDVSLSVDKKLAYTINTPIINPYNILDFVFQVNIPLDSGYHRIGFTGWSRGTPGQNVHFQIINFTTAENLPVYNLPVDKRRKYKGRKIIIPNTLNKQ